MNKSDKHKPLSAEELFKLLGEKSNKANDFEALDDFEKEALEGFTAFSSADKAKTLMEELNTAILKKASEHKGTRKNRIIWFSAAASIIVIVMISIFFLNETKQSVDSNIALNETKDTEKQKEQEIITPSEMVTEATEKNADQSLLRKAGPQALADNLQAKGESEKTAAQPATMLAENKPQSGFAASGNGLKDGTEAKNEKDDSNLEQQTIVLDSKADTKQAERRNQDKEQSVADEVLANQNAVTTVASTETKREEAAYQYKIDANKNFESGDNAKKRKLEKEKAADNRANDDKASAKMSAAPVQISADMDSSHPYYEGGESAIRKFMVTHLKEKGNTKTIIGKYKITGVIDAKGKFKTLSVIQLSREYCGCTELIKEALETSTKWITSRSNGNMEIEFVITF